MFSLRRWVGAAAWPRRSSGTKAAPSRRRASMPARAARPARDDDGIRAVRQALAGERREKLALAVAGDAGDADDLARPGREVDVTQRLAVQARRAAWTEPRP